MISNTTSHHTAFEYHALANQVYYEVYISSEAKFKDFEFEGAQYKYVTSKFSNGVIKLKNTEGIRVTDLERTVNAPANRYLVGSKINETACLSYHTAFELHGLAHQASFVMYVESDRIFSDLINQSLRLLWRRS